MSVDEVESPMGSRQESLHPGCDGNMWLQDFWGTLASGLGCLCKIFQDWVQAGQRGQEIRAVVFWRFRGGEGVSESQQVVCPP